MSVKVISENDITYLCNAAGDAFWWDGNNPMNAKFEGERLVDEHIAEPLRFAYNNLWGEDYGYPTYCATYLDKPVVLLVAEFGNYDFDTGIRRNDYKDAILRAADQMSEEIEDMVLFPEDTDTPFCQWECMVAIPVSESLTREYVQDVANAMNQIFTPVYDITEE